jgi:UDP-N-acetylglucosamine--N-acetylmuramyl-(pentapeptide) pyrophosphoryl-undecaprenol N-acetylglucosamine transferase
MGKALAAADLVVSRAGASSLGEFPFFELPAVLVPYPYAWRYQKVNASYLADHGAAVILDDSRLQEELLDTIKVLLENPGKRESMKKAMRSLSKPEAAQAIASQLIELQEKKAYDEYCLCLLDVCRLVCGHRRDAWLGERIVSEF